MRYFFCLAFLFSFLFVTAQVKPEFFPEDINPEGIVTRCYCEPGVKNKSRSKGLEIAYTFIGDGTFKPEDSPLSEPFPTFSKIQQWEVDMKVPIVNRDNFKLLIGYKYFSEKLAFENLGNEYAVVFGDLNETPIKNNSFSILLNKPLDEFRYIAMRLRYSSNGNYEGWMNFGNQYRIYKFLGSYVMKPHEDLEWGFGISAARGFRGTSALPFLLYNRNFNDKWGIESVFPAYIFGRRNIKPKMILLAGMQYNSQSYRLGVVSPTDDFLDYAYNHSEVIWSLQLEQHLTTWIWANFKFGYQSNFSSDFEAKFVNTPYFNVEPTNSWFFNVGLFLSPTKKGHEHTN